MSELKVNSQEFLIGQIDANHELHGVGRRMVIHSEDDGFIEEG